MERHRNQRLGGPRRHRRAHHRHALSAVSGEVPPFHRARSHAAAECRGETRTAARRVRHLPAARTRHHLSGDGSIKLRRRTSVDLYPRGVDRLAGISTRGDAGPGDCRPDGPVRHHRLEDMQGAVRQEAIRRLWIRSVQGRARQLPGQVPAATRALLPPGQSQLWIQGGEQVDRATQSRHPGRHAHGAGVKTRNVCIG